MGQPSVGQGRSQSDHRTANSQTRDPHTVELASVRIVRRIYEEIVGYGADSGSGGREYSIQKLLLIDTTYSDSRRYTAFVRQSEDWKRVQGLLTLEVSRQ